MCHLCLTAYFSILDIYYTWKYISTIYNGTSNTNTSPDLICTLYFYLSGVIIICQIDKSMSKIDVFRSMRHRQQTFLGNPTESFVEEEKKIRSSARPLSSTAGARRSGIVRRFFPKEKDKEAFLERIKQEHEENATIQRILLEQEAEEEKEIIQSLALNPLTSNWRKASMFVSAVAGLKKASEGQGVTYADNENEGENANENANANENENATSSDVMEMRQGETE